MRKACIIIDIAQQVLLAQMVWRVVLGQHSFRGQVGVKRPNNTNLLSATYLLFSVEQNHVSSLIPGLNKEQTNWTNIWNSSSCKPPFPTHIVLEGSDYFEVKFLYEDNFWKTKTDLKTLFLQSLVC